MRKLIAAVLFIFAVVSFSAGSSESAVMNDYCTVPPYVVQNVPPNIMIVADNSGSMFNFAYGSDFLKCPTTTTSVKSGSEFTNRKIYVDSVENFQVGQVLSLWDDYDNHLDGAGDCVGCYWNNNLTVTAVNAGESSISVSGSNHYQSGAPLVKTSCVTIPDSNQPPYTVNYDTLLQYYGYFNPDYWYEYASNRFYPTVLKSSRAKASTEWDGNFLNWVTMRRIDVLRKVLTGGATTSGEGSGYDRMVGERPDSSNRGYEKTVYNAETYMPISGTDQTRCLYSYPGSSNPSRFYYSESSSSCSTSTSRIRRNVQVKVPSPVEGMLQRLVGTRARVGLSFYNPNTSSSNEGGYIAVSMDGQALSSVVNEVNNKRPNSNTPLGETLWTVAGYFGQKDRFQGYSSGPGPRYSNGDYVINDNNDPYNYSSTGTPRYPKCAKSFVLYITDGEPCQDGNLPSSIETFASGKSVFDCSGGSCPATAGISPETWSFNASTFPTCSGNSVAGIEDVALWAHTTDLRSSTLGKNDIASDQTLNVYTVFAFGRGSTLLRYTAINGGFVDLDGDGVPSTQEEWDADFNGEPDTFFEATDGFELEAKIESALTSMLTRAASGTAASVLASGEGSGANLIQAVFYPKRRFSNDVISWTGSIQNLWYYVDPLLTTSSIREDTDPDSDADGYPDLNLLNDYVTQFYYDSDLGIAMAERSEDTDGDGDGDVQRPTVQFEDVSNLWEAGYELWKRDLATDPRVIYTPDLINGTSPIVGTGLIAFTNTSGATFLPYMGLTNATDDDYDGDGDADSADANILIDYVHGIDRLGLRNRTVSADASGERNVWKLGDIINSTARIATWMSLNLGYYKTYGDTTYKAFTETTGYQDRGMVFTGGNDGMLHAFNLGQLVLVSDQSTPQIKARLIGTDLGKEEWSFIPKNALPYLKYTADPGYCHIYSVDLSPFLVDVSLGIDDDLDDDGTNDQPSECTSSEYWNCVKSVDSWRTVLIGGMRYGGACKNSTSSCTEDLNGDGVTNDADCVQTPIDGVGYSSYFALDITDTENPKLLWEFTNPDLGFTTSGPAIIRINGMKDTTSDGIADTKDADGKERNGRWYVVFGSGPTGPIDDNFDQFLGYSDQNLKLFVLDLKTGTLLRTIDTGVQYAFAGSMINVSNDSNLDYEDDALYHGYVKRVGNAGSYTWNDGGVARVLTKEDLNPDNWLWSKVIDDIGPVTSAVGRLQEGQGVSTDKLRLYVGTGRYYYELGTETDDPTGQRRLMAIVEPCFDGGTYPSFKAICTDADSANDPVVTLGDLGDMTNVGSGADTSAGWYINLDASGSYTYPEGDPAVDVTKDYSAERVITDPATFTSGFVFFASYKPYNESCSIGGKTFIWAVDYDTGGVPTNISGKALIQVSTGAIEEVDLVSAFTGSDSKGGRRSYAVEGVPPSAQGLSLFQSPPPVNRVIYVREK